jgi:hypothetical protein
MFPPLFNRGHMLEDASVLSLLILGVPANSLTVVTSLRA